jgi:hypothetical protein
MKVKELIEELSKHDPSMEVESWIGNKDAPGYVSFWAEVDYVSTVTDSIFTPVPVVAIHMWFTREGIT